MFLGCSLPLSDYEFRYLLLSTAVRSKDNKIRVLVYPKASAEQKKELQTRFKTLFIGNDIKFEEMDISDFLINKEMIWDW